MTEQGTSSRVSSRGSLPPGPAEIVSEPTGPDPIGRWTDQAYNVILLAEDEARMLAQPRVEPEHLLLAAARRGNVHQLLAREGISAGAIHAALARTGGFGAELVLGRVPRSNASEEALRRAIAAAATRGIRGPSTEHLLLGLAEQRNVRIILRELGAVDVVALVDSAYPVIRQPVEPDTSSRTPPSPGPIPPLFERFSAEAHLAVGAAVDSASSLGNQYVTPTHVLLALLGAQRGVVASVRTRHRRQFDAMAARATELMGAHSTAARLAAHGVVDSRGFRRSTRPTGIFTGSARRLVADGALVVAHRLGHRSLGTGHLLVAVLENPDEATTEIVQTGAPQFAAEVIDALPGDERG